MTRADDATAGHLLNQIAELCKRRGNPRHLAAPTRDRLATFLESCRYHTKDSPIADGALDRLLSAFRSEGCTPALLRDVQTIRGLLNTRGIKA